MTTTNQLTQEEQIIQQEMDTYVTTHQKSLGSTKQVELLHMTQLAQQQYEATKKTKQISIRISEKDLVGIKAKALKLGMPYQTLI